MESLSQITQPLVKVFKQYHTTIITVVLATLIGLAVFALSQVVTLSATKSVDGYSPVSKANGNFDQKTIDRIDSLKPSSDDTGTLTFPTRVSPFAE